MNRFLLAFAVFLPFLATALVLAAFALLGFR